MSNQLRAIIKEKEQQNKRDSKIKLRKHLRADALVADIRSGFINIKDHRPGNVTHSLADTLMSGFAMFSLKDRSLLAFDERRRKAPHNLLTIYGMGSIPSDTSIHDILDGVDPNDLRPLFKDAFRSLQRGKVLENLVFMEGAYLLNLDGTGYFSSKKLHSDRCLQKVNPTTGEITYQLQTIGATLVHPYYKEIIPLCPEMIIKQDGETKNDCERNAVKRLLKKFRQDHPHLNVIMNEDGLSSNAPHIEDLIKYNCSFILGAKQGDHKYLFQFVDQAVENGEAIEFANDEERNPDIYHCFRIVYNAPLNKSNQHHLVTFIEYWQYNVDKGIEQHFSWITDLDITEENVYLFMRGARARWKIENEGFNTLKNQGYNFGHNYGLGKQSLSEVFVMLMMLAFLVDQIVQLCCPLFKAAWKEWGTKISLWEKFRSKFHEFRIETMEDLYRSLLYHDPVPLPK